MDKKFKDCLEEREQQNQTLQEKLKIEGIRNARQGDAISLIHFN